MADAPEALTPPQAAYDGPMARGASRTWLFPLGAVVVAAALYGALGSNSKPALEQPSASAAHPEPPVMEPPPKAAADTPADSIQKMQSLGDAVAFTRPMMTDETDKMSLGAVLLAVWAQTHLRFSDVSVSQNETSLALVRKSPGAERGKRLCGTGPISDLEAEQTRWGAVSHGLLKDPTNPLFFIAVGSTRTLSAGSPARFCGVVAGNFDSSTKAAGVSHAVQVVGMFDLPENK
jgi:hypothetical protein